ncbi:MAG: flavodoxin family protein [Candidatus Omnitrophota bacterium]|jgi:multimeric flavodoxin WrbA
MRILGISGSPRINGNTEILLDKALEGAGSSGAECEKVVLENLDISPVREIEYEEVSPEGLSPVRDDIYIIYRKMMEADRLIVASPIFFGSLSAQTKMMIDRFQCVWVAKNMRNIDVFTKKIKGAFICVEAAERKDFFDNAKTVIKNFFVTINADYEGELLCTGVDAKGSILKERDMLEKAFALGKKLAREND